MAVLGRLTNDSSFDDVAQAIILETKRRGYDPSESIACVSTGIQESGLNPKAVNPAGPWIGVYQQDSSYPGRNDANTQISGFLDKLDEKRRSGGASIDPFMNIFWLQQRPGEPSAGVAYQNGRKAYLTEIKSHIKQASDLYNRLQTTQNIGEEPPDMTNRPDFNEYGMFSPNNQGRSGTRVDLFLLHTQEGDGNADSLARFLQNPANEVSYHYTISEDFNDHGVTVCDVVDTDNASWSVLSANNRSINLCFAGSRAGWTRDEWLRQSRAIDVAAYLAVQDCKKYGIPTKVLAPPYNSNPPGISDHKYVTQWLKDGTHTDVGNNFPWDVFTAAVNKYAAPAAPPAPPPPPPGGKMYPQDFTDRQLMEDVWTQLRGPGGNGWPQLGQNDKGQNLTLIDALAALLKK